MQYLHSSDFKCHSSCSVSALWGQVNNFLSMFLNLMSTTRVKWYDNLFVQLTNKEVYFWSDVIKQQQQVLTHCFDLLTWLFSQSLCTTLLISTVKPQERVSCLHNGPILFDQRLTNQQKCVSQIILQKKNQWRLQKII